MHSVHSADGTRIAYDREGDGPTLILVGGAFQYRSADTRTADLARLLAQRYTVVHYDRRGRGDSGDTAPYAVVREVEDLAAIVAATAGSSGHVQLFGMSSGGALALDAVAAGLPVARLAVYEPPFVVDDSRPPVPADWVARIDKFLAADRRGEAVEYFLTAAVAVPEQYLPQMRREPMWAGFEAVAHTLAYDARIMDGFVGGRPLPTGRWTGVDVPALVVDGGASPAAAHAAADALAHLLPGARRVTVPGQEHAVAPEALAPTLTAFYQS